MSSRTAPTRVLLGAWSLLLLAGCGGPTYRKEQLAESLQELLTADRLQSSVRIVEHTLAVQLVHPEILVQQESQLLLGPQFDEASRLVIQALHRVLLSTDADIRFYVVLLSDPNIPGAYVTLVRYLDDVRRAQANMMDIPEMFARTVFDLNVVGQTSLTIEQYVPREILLEDFLSWQLARRLQHTLAQTLSPVGSAQVGRCGGEFRDGEFAFTLNVIPSAEGALDDATLQQIFQASTNEIAKVLSGYRFDGYDRVRLVLPALNRNLILPKTNLQAFQ